MADPPSPSGAPLPPPPQINYSLPPPKIFSKPDSSPISNGLIGSSGSVWPPMLPMNKVPDSDKKSDSAPSSSSYDVLLRKTSASWDHPGELGKIRQHVQNTYSPLSSQVLSQEEPGLRVRFGRLYEAVTFYRNGPRDPVLADERYGLEFNLECSQEISEELYPETESEESSSEERESSYFRSYGRSSIHRTMIHDQVRTQAYRRAIQDKRYLFRDKVVLDVGCGTGILSLFAAKVSWIRQNNRHCVYTLCSLFLS